MKNMVVAKRRSVLAQIAIVITDGRSNVNRGLTISNAQEAKDEDITIIALGFNIYIYIHIKHKQYYNIIILK